MVTTFTIEFTDEETGRIYIPLVVRKREKLQKGDFIEVSVDKLDE